MEQSVQDALTEVLAKETWTVEDYSELMTRLLSASEPSRKFKEMLSALEAANPEPKGTAALKIGIARYVVCRFRAALEALASAVDNKDRRYFQGLCYKQLQQYGKAEEEFRRAADKGWTGPEADVQICEAQALGGDLDGAEKSLGKLQGGIGGTADFHYLKGLIANLRGSGEQAAESYAKALEIDRDHVMAKFRLAYYNDLHGDEAGAIELYKECLKHPPIHVNVLLNLAVLYEDIGQYDKAVRCIKRILAANPSHERARLFLRDADSSKTMFYDEDQARRQARRSAVMDIPVTDFELSVRARNCLKKMNIRTLGDLVRTTEPELLAYKNFGETSLKEIKQMLTAKSLHLGQALEEGSELAEVAVVRRPSVSNEGVLATAIEHVEFSVRARRALETLKVQTLGDLVAKSEAEMLACRNFGQTSLNEIRQRLAEYGLSLREST